MLYINIHYVIVQQGENKLEVGDAGSTKKINLVYPSDIMPLAIFRALFIQSKFKNGIKKKWMN